VLAGVLWKAEAGGWYLLAAGSEDVSEIEASGGVTGSVEGRLLAVEAEQGAQAGLDGVLESGREISGLR
jgi:hypothetical protein